MKIREIHGRSYRLPDVLTAFQQEMYVHLIEWKWKHVSPDPGYHKHRGTSIPYDAILPPDKAGEMPHIYEPMRQKLIAHRRRNPFRIHPHFYHMSSSQAANINLFLPILHHSAVSNILREIIPSFKALVTDQLDAGYCLEFWGGNYGDDKFDKGLLGDKSPQAGTDADIAIAYRNHQDELCLWLVEHKLTEKEFTDCGGFRSKGRKDKKRYDCTKTLPEILADKTTCYYHDKCGYNYLNIMERHRGFFQGDEESRVCPFRGGINQLWRNQLLALAIEGHPFKHAHFSVVRHPDNTSLAPTLEAYQKLVANNDKFSTITSRQVIEAAERHADDSLREWCGWYRRLYRV